MFKCYDCLKDKSLAMISLPSYDIAMESKQEQL